MLAVAGDSGLSRDKLVTLLWPEAEEERARHSLTQALYAARRALGADDLFVTSGDIRLNRERLTSDVGELEAALANDELERAAALYQGPFLDGFFLPGSVEFEQWATAQRQRLEDRAAGALDRLARAAEDAGDVREALDWRRRLAAIRPLDASVAVSLMTVLAQTGDRAGALQHARLHETLLRDQLGLDPDPVVSSFAARLREPIDWQREAQPAAAGATAAAATAVLASPPAFTPTLAPPTEVEPEPEPAPEPEVAAAALPVRIADPDAGPVRVVPAPGRPRWRLGVAAAIAVVVALVAGVVWWRREPPAAPVAAAPRLEQKVVVAPFRVTGASGSLAYLRDGLAELLAARLADDSSARSVDAGTVLAAWRSAGLTGSGEVPRDTVVRLAERLGAERVVVGSVVGTPSRVVVSATVVAVPSGEASAEASVEGPADSVTALVDRLAARLLVLGAGEDASLSSQTTGSLRALRAFLDGQAAFRRGSHAVAVRRFEEALQVDSTFALAALQLARASDRLHLSAPRARAIALAWRERSTLDERARALLVALAGPRYPAPSSAEEQVAAWERLIDLTPDRAEPWFELAARLHHEGATVGIGDGRTRAITALRRALALEPTYVPARELLAQIDASQAVDARLPLAPFLRWRAAVVAGDSTALRTMRASLAQLGPTNLRAIAMASQQDAVALDDARRAVRQLAARGGRPADRVDALLAEHALALNEGRARDALAATERLAELRPGTRGHLRLRVLDALYGDGRRDAGDAAALTLQRAADAAPAAEPTARAIQLADVCVVAHWRLARGDTAGVRRAVEQLRAEPLRVPLAAPPAAAGGAACAALLEAALAVERRAPDAAAAVARLDALALTAAVSDDAVAYAPILVARLHARLGDGRSALGAVRRRGYQVAWPRYLAAALRDEGRYAAQEGDMDAARDAYERFLMLRADPDPELRPQVDEVRAALNAP
ncbi:BTAD domain-containing putative transcriptional regulator [Roseisolibacter agri]|uniref:BTAD domain-containing putative transcriptional regulator n=1 Tax=Roseisolibacter agri TaxID=2014610 RepID=UPI0024E10162|nr:BTAD domain-containing putative transcriptional regulator [Roseisolibacter agri]